MSSVQGKKNNSEVVVPLNNDVDVLLKKVALQEKKIRDLQLALNYFKPVVEDYYKRKELEGLMGYE